MLFCNSKFRSYDTSTIFHDKKSGPAALQWLKMLCCRRFCNLHHITGDFNCTRAPSDIIPLADKQLLY